MLFYKELKLCYNSGAAFVGQNTQILNFAKFTVQNFQIGYFNLINSEAGKKKPDIDLSFKCSKGTKSYMKNYCF